MKLQEINETLQRWADINLSKDKRTCLSILLRTSSAYSGKCLLITFSHTQQKYHIYLCREGIYKFYYNNEPRYCLNIDDLLDTCISIIMTNFDMLDRYQEDRILLNSVPVKKNLTFEQPKGKPNMIQHPALVKIEEKRDSVITKINDMNRAESQLKSLKALMFRLSNEEELMQRESSTIIIGGAAMNINSNSPLGKLLIANAISFIETDIQVLKRELKRHEDSI